MPMRAGGRRVLPYRLRRYKTLHHIRMDLVTYLSQRIPKDHPYQPSRKALRAAKQALTILQQANEE